MQSTSTRRHNPYADLAGTWIRGSFHGHCSENSRCASVPLNESVRMYHEVGAGFVTITDHDVITDLSAVQSEYPDLVFIQGFEYSSRENVVFAGPGVSPLYKRSLEDALSDAGDLLTIVAHPHRWGTNRKYWTLPMLEELGTWPDGTEVYNGHYGIESALASGRWPLYNEFWDVLLTAGHRVWGYANDDFHDPADFGNAFNMVHVQEVSPSAVIQAAKSGRCYASTGVLLEEIAVNDRHISVELNSECQGRFIGPGGKVLSASEGAEFEHNMGDEAYVRFEAEGDSGRIFLQPMFLETEGEE
jgi:hypothetical protein